MASALIAQSPTIATANTAAANIQLAAFICSSPHSLSRTASRRPLFASTQHIYAHPLLPPPPPPGGGGGGGGGPGPPPGPPPPPPGGPPPPRPRGGGGGWGGGGSRALPDVPP